MIIWCILSLSFTAVREELRGKGYGQQILTQLIERYKGQPFVLD
ncbi:MAG: GNAT family N-acetyltransferase, partial [Prevotella sp.]|nr:GNAT family N-acetyltransferase [Prevotella sp.]